MPVLAVFAPATDIRHGINSPVLQKDDKGGTKGIVAAVFFLKFSNEFKGMSRNHAVIVISSGYQSSGISSPFFDVVQRRIGVKIFKILLLIT
jgi:hypothetical protein